MSSGSSRILKLSLSYRGSLKPNWYKSYPNNWVLDLELTFCYGMSSKMEGSRGSSGSRHAARVKTQTPIDAELHSNYEKGEYNYSTSLNSAITSVSTGAISAYLHAIERGSFIQSFGCMIAVEEKNLTVIAFSENTYELLDLTPHDVPSMGQEQVLTFGTDVRTLFRSSGAKSIEKAADFPEVNLLNPILVHSRSSGRLFYAILHRTDLGLVIDLEPVSAADMPVSAAGPLKSYKLAAKPILKMQSLPGGNITLLCDVLVKEVRDLTGYDRVMIYKFHDDEHGEVVSEWVKPGLEPYLGLHYPATDIPQAARFLFLKNKVRMICDCLASPVKILHDKSLPYPINLCGSTLRAPHGCHAEYMYNMGSIASLVMAVSINDDDAEDNVGIIKNDHLRRRLWGLVVCHHTSPRSVPFPLRYACKFLIQVFSIQINKEVELAVQLREKHILRTQTYLCDMILHNVPVGIVSQSPSVMDLVKCDGAALYYRRKFWLLGITPTEVQIQDIVEWLLEYHGESTGISTDSLLEAGYPGARTLGKIVCGMTVIRISSRDFLFWFRSHTAKEIMWGGLRHNPDQKDDGTKMHPRLSFKAFLEEVKHRSFPWEDLEIDAIHSLQMILRGSMRDHGVDISEKIASVEPTTDDRASLGDHGVDISEKIASVEPTTDDRASLGVEILTDEMARLLESASVPIFAVDTSGCVNAWNAKVAELTGLSAHNAMGLHFPDLIVGDSVDVVNNLLSLALEGIEEKDVEIELKTFGDLHGGRVILTLNACSSHDTKNVIVGVCFVGHDVTTEKIIADKYTRIQGDYVSIISNPSTLIPPIFITDEHGRCVEWNHAMEEFSGLKRDDTIQRTLIGEVFTNGEYGCRVKNLDMLTRLRIFLNSVISGNHAEKMLLGFFDQRGQYLEALLSANVRTDTNNRVNGALFFLHVASPELQHAMEMQRILEQAALRSMMKLDIIRHELWKPLNGMKFLQDLMVSCSSDKEHNQLARTKTLCLQQLLKVVDDTDIENIGERYMEINSEEFILGEALEAAISQVMPLSEARQIRVVRDWPSKISFAHVYGDSLRLQQVLANFLSASLLYTAAFEAFSVVMKVVPQRENLGRLVHILHLKFCIIHPAPGIPNKLSAEMFEYCNDFSQEGLGLYISQKLVKIMNGTVQYQRKGQHSSFVLHMEFPLSRDGDIW